MKYSLETARKFPKRTNKGQRKALQLMSNQGTLFSFDSSPELVSERALFLHFISLSLLYIPFLSPLFLSFERDFEGQLLSIQSITPSIK